MNDLKSIFLKRESSYCLIGSSGVGKTTLLNSIIGNDQLETQPVSKTQSKGRHTTTSRQYRLFASVDLLYHQAVVRSLGTSSKIDLLVPALQRGNPVLDAPASRFIEQQPAYFGAYPAEKFAQMIYA